MDEPFGSLDAQTRSLMQELLLAVWERHHQTVLFITHDIEEALLLADSVCVMTARPGRIKKSIDVRPAAPARAGGHDLAGLQRAAPRGARADPRGKRAGGDGLGGPLNEKTTVPAAVGIEVEDPQPDWVCSPPGREIPRSASPATFPSRLMAMSPNERMPTSRLLRLSTGKRRTWMSAMLRVTSSIS